MNKRISAPQLMWAALACARLDECHDTSGLCYVCGSDAPRGLFVSEWMKSTYTSQMAVANYAGKCVCEACVLLGKQRYPVPGRPAKEGKMCGGHWCTYSHLVEAGWTPPGFGEEQSPSPHYANATKGDKDIIRGFLSRSHVGPWFAAISDSGKKYVLHFAQVNGPGSAGMVMFEEQEVWWPGTMELVDAITTMLTLGVTKEELASGSFRSKTWQTLADEVRCFERQHSKERGSGYFDLCLWLSQREDNETRHYRELAGGHDTGAQERLLKEWSKPHGPLDPAGESLQSSGDADGDNIRVVQPSAKKAANPKLEQGQLCLFG